MLRPARRVDARRRTKRRIRGRAELCHGLSMVGGGGGGGKDVPVRASRTPMALKRRTHRPQFLFSAVLQDADCNRRLHFDEHWPQHIFKVTFKTMHVKFIYSEKATKF